MVKSKCVICGKHFMQYPSHISKSGPKCSRKCMGIYQSRFFRGEKSSHWKGGFKDRNCLQCNTKIPNIKNKRYSKFCSKVCGGIWRSKHRVMEKSANWRGGRRLHKGYVIVKSPKHPNRDFFGYVREHRLVMEKYLGRYLRKNEVVHHINHIKTDNRIENLHLFKNHKEHMRICHKKNGSHTATSAIL